jgi:hypothetical protein
MGAFEVHHQVESVYEDVLAEDGEDALCGNRNSGHSTISERA